MKDISYNEKVKLLMEAMYQKKLETWRKTKLNTYGLQKKIPFESKD